MLFPKTLGTGLLAVALTIGSISATPITAGGFIAAGGMASLGAIPGGTLLASTSGPFASSNPGDYNGTYSAWVYRNASNTLDFIYSFVSASNSLHSIQSVTMSDFSSSTTDVYFVTGGINPATLSGNAATRSADGRSLKFIYDTTGVAPGQTASTLVIRTNATVFTTGSFTFQNGSTATVSAFAPSAVPEPGTYALVGSALAVLGYLRRRRA